MLENLLEYYRKSDGATREKILNTIFAEKLIVINGKFATLSSLNPYNSSSGLVRFWGVVFGRGEGEKGRLEERTN